MGNTTSRPNFSSSSSGGGGGGDDNDHDVVETPYTTLAAGPNDLHHHHHHHYNKNNNKEQGDVENSNNDNNDDDDDHYTLTSTVLTEEGIHDPTGFWVVCAVILLGDMSRGVFFPSMWPLVEQHLGGSQVTLGYSIASFSFGRILVNPLFGSWSHKYGYTFTLLVACSILWIGTLLYVAVWHMQRWECLIVAQTVLGVGSGTLGVTRAFVADTTAQRLRTQYMAWITAVQYAGFTVTPVIGYALNHVLGNVNLQQQQQQQNNNNNNDNNNNGGGGGGGFFVLNRYTAPAYFMTCVATIVIILLLTLFQNRHRVTIRKDKKKKSQKRAAIDQEASRIVPVIGMTIYDCCIAGCLLLNVATKGSIASFETMGVAVADSHFAESLEQYAGLIVGVSGAVGVVVLLQMGHLTALWTDIQLIVGGMLIMAVGVALWTTLSDDVANNPTWKYVVTIVLIYAVGYPVGHTAVIGLFSKSKYSMLASFSS